MSQRSLLIFCSMTLIPFLLQVTCSQNDDSPNKKQFQEKIYDENVNAKVDIANAIKIAQQNGKYILLMFGGNWCVWCHRLHKLFLEDIIINKFLNENYILVMIDVGKRDKNLDLNQQYGNPYQHGFPVLVVLDKNGNQLHTQETGSLEYNEPESTEKGHHPARVLQFLKNWAPKPSGTEVTLQLLA